jgi:hypothetical protein
VNEELPSESSLNLTLLQHLHDEDPEPREVRVRFEIEPPRAWYYCIYLNSCTLLILLQVNPALVMNMKPSVKVVMKLKTLLSLHGFQFSTLDIIVGCMV